MMLVSRLVGFSENTTSAFLVTTFCLATILIISQRAARHIEKDGGILSISRIKMTGRSLRTTFNMTNGMGSIFLQNPRRNHDVIVLEDKMLINIGGRGIKTIEILDLSTGEQSLIEDESFDFNHMIAVHAHEEIYLVCGLIGGAVNNETSAEFIYIFNWESKSIRIGPKMRKARGGCGAVILKQVVVQRDQLVRTDTISSMDSIQPRSWSEDLICVMGGSAGPHDYGTIVPDVDCYSKRGEGWIVFPPLPIQVDHLTAHVVTSRDESNFLVEPMKSGSKSVISSTYHEDQFIMVVGGRAENYRNDRTEIFKLSLKTGTWDLVTHMIHAKSSFSSVLVKNRYIITLGGVAALPQPPRERQEWIEKITYNQIEICDVQQKTCTLSTKKLAIKRFATAATSTNHTVFICGGTEFGMTNLGDCEMFAVNELLNSQQI
jgi:hypothetical protein